MRSFEIHVAPAEHALPRSVGSSDLLFAGPRDARESLDVFIDGANVTARVAEGHAACVLRDLALAVAELRGKSTGKAIVHFYDEPWEMCIERVRSVALISVYRAGTEPEVRVYDARVPFADVVLAAGNALREVSPSPELTAALRALEGSLDVPSSQGDEPANEASPASVEMDQGSPISFAADFSLRSQPSAELDGAVEHTDLHGLLFQGRVRAMVRGRTVDAGVAHPFLFAERLLDLVRRALDAWEHGQVLQVREDAGGVLVGIRVSSSGEVTLSLESVVTFPALAIVDVAHATLAFGRSLVRAMLRRDRAQSRNLRLSAFRRAVRDTEARVRGATSDDAKLNVAPESYRAFALSAGGRTSQREPAEAPTRLRYVPRWRALVPGIDLRATFLCGDRLIVGASQETFCLERGSGEVRWRVPTRRATSVVTPAGIARLHADGELAVHDFSTGEVTMRTRLLPRHGAAPAGAVVSTPGLPRLLIVTEGDRHLVAVDLNSGEPRWRFAWNHGGALRLRRHGKLLYFTSTTNALSALDVVTGSIVWRVRDRLRFCGSPVVEHDLCLAVAGGVSGATLLYAVDAFSGAVRWASTVPGPDPGGDLAVASHDLGHPVTVEGSPMLAARVVVVAVRDRHGLRLAAFERESGLLRWTSAATVAPVGTSWLVIDDVIVGNTPTGELVGIDVSTGGLRYRHVLGRTLEADIPRRLEPVLRSGAVFVPHTDVRIFRPSDGAALGSVGPCEAIPDLLRVDERCDVFVAEESGHMAAFGTGPRLTLVR